jgi:hypothetical protein
MVLLRKPLSGLANRRKQPERYVQFLPNICEKIIKKSRKLVDKLVK